MNILRFSGLFLLAALPAHAAIIWTGAADTDIFNEANWDLTGSLVTAVDPNVTIADDVTFTNATVSIPDVAGQQRFQVGSGFIITVDNSSIIAAANDGIAGPVGSNNPVGPLGPTVNVVNGSSFEPFFIFQGLDLYIDGTSSAQFRGGGNPINVSRVHLETGATLALNTAAEFFEHGHEIFINGEPYVDRAVQADNSPGTANDALWDNTGTSRVAVPEPSSFLLIGLAGLGLIVRRRK